jgi:hypothetical protein
VSRATEVYAREFDSVLFNLPRQVRELIEAKIHDLGARLTTCSHRLTGRPEFRLRVGRCHVERVSIGGRVSSFFEFYNLLRSLCAGVRNCLRRASTSK